MVQIEVYRETSLLHAEKKDEYFDEISSFGGDDDDFFFFFRRSRAKDDEYQALAVNLQPLLNHHFQARACTGLHETSEPRETRI